MTSAGYCAEPSCMGRAGHIGPHTSVDFRVVENEAQLRADAAIYGFSVRGADGRRIDPTSIDFESDD